MFVCSFISQMKSSIEETKSHRLFFISVFVILKARMKNAKEKQYFIDIFLQNNIFTQIHNTLNNSSNCNREKSSFYTFLLLLF